jgi:hypothetical protein
MSNSFGGSSSSLVVAVIVQLPFARVKMEVVVCWSDEHEQVHASVGGRRTFTHTNAQARRRTSKQAGKQAGGHAGNQAGTQASRHEGKQAGQRRAGQG